MTSVLGLALYGPLAASNRQRLGQYVPKLKELGINLEVNSLLGDDYLRCRFAGQLPPIGSMIGAGFRRLDRLLNHDRYELAILYGELFPLMPGLLERGLLRLPYIYDFDDAFHLKYRIGRLKAARPLLGDKFDTVIRGAAAVTAGSQVLASYARNLNVNTHFLPTVVDTIHYAPARAERVSRTLTVGWIGSPSTAPYLSILTYPLAIIGREGPVRLLVVGGQGPSIKDVEVINIPWEEGTEIDLLNTFDVGVMPLPDNEWTRGKCAYKLIQYMACGVPVVASPVGANCDVVDSRSGFLAASSEEWVAALRTLRDSPQLRTTMGAAGRNRVERDYSLDRSVPILASIVRQALSTL